MGRPRTADQYRLWQHDNGTWYVLWTAPGGTKRVSTGTKSKREADRWLDQHIAGAMTPAAPDVPTVGTILEGYLADRKPRVRSYQTLDYSCRPLRKELGNLEPAHLTTSVMRRYAKARHLAGRQDGTIIREIVTLRAALKWAKAEGWLKTIPSLPMPVSAAPAKDRWLTKEEARRLLDNAKSYHVKLFILLAVHTAARRGAIMELKWSRVDLEYRRIDYGRGHGNKNRSVVPINDVLLEALKTAQKIACSEFVMEFNGQRVSSIRTGFEKACERAGLTDVTPHVLRHTAATWAVMEGVPIGEVARLLGDSEKMVERVYGKHTPDFLRRAVASTAF